MSIEMYVLLAEADLPQTASIQHCAQSLGYVFSLHEANLKTHTGFLPARLDGVDTGCEVYASKRSSIDLPTKKLDARLNFVCWTRTGGDLRESLAATVFLQAVQKLSRGAFWYPDADTLLSGDEAFAFLGEQAKAMQMYLHAGQLPR